MSVPSNPFIHNAVRRYYYAWEQLHSRTGKHLDVGCCRGDFLGVLQQTSKLVCFGIDPHAGYLSELHDKWPAIPVKHILISGKWDFSDDCFSSISALDVLEHVPDERLFLEEVWRVLKPGGVFVLSVPHKHLFSFLDPDNAKFNYPVLHRLVYSARFGKKIYHERFVDVSNGLRGDMSVGKSDHTNYRAEELEALLKRIGFICEDKDGANLFWRFFHVPALLVPGFLRPFLNYLIYIDGIMFKKANLFMTLSKR